MNVKEALNHRDKLADTFFYKRSEDQHAVCVLGDEVRRLQSQLGHYYQRVIELETKLSNIEIAQFNNGNYI